MKTDAKILRDAANLKPYEDELRVAMFVDYVGSELEYRTGLVCSIGTKYVKVVTLASPVRVVNLTREEIVRESRTGARYDYRSNMLAIIRKTKRCGRTDRMTKEARRLLDVARQEVETW